MAAVALAGGDLPAIGVASWLRGAPVKDGEIDNLLWKSTALSSA